MIQKFLRSLKRDTVKLSLLAGTVAYSLIEQPQLINQALELFGLSRQHAAIVGSIIVFLVPNLIEKRDTRRKENGKL